MSALYWREPAWLLLGLLPLLWLAAGRWRAVRLQRRYADPALWAWALGDRRPAGAAWRRTALCAAWLLLGLAAAGPRLPGELPAAHAGAPATLMVVLDLSRSMDAEDVWPSRRGLALRALRGLLPELAASRVGLVVVAGRAHRLWPASSDRQGLARLLEEMPGLRPPSHGSVLADGVTLAVDDLSASPGPRQLLLLSDGDLETTRREALGAALARARPAGIGVLIAGVGSAAGASLPGADGDWLRRDGAPVLSRRDADALQTLAETAGGSYLNLPPQQSAPVLADALPASFKRLQLDADAPVLWRELFPWLLGPALLLWLVGLARLPGPAAPVGLAVAALYLIGLTLALPVRADPYTAAHRALAGGDPLRARLLFDALPGYAARMGSGSACHRQGNWRCARRAFAQAVLDAPDDHARAAAIYNLAHSSFQAGDFAAAAQLFDDALRYRSDYPAARHNRDFAAALAAEVARLAGDEQAGRRAGRGPASSAAVDAPPPTAGLTLAPRDDSPAVPLSAAQRQQLLNRGLAFTRLAASQQADARAPWGRGYGGEGAGELADITLWQTLLERAEGLPASPEEPLVLPGVRPW